MSRKLLLLSTVLLASATLSCRRDHLWYASTNTATVLVNADWSKSGTTPHGMTVWAFREEDGSLYKRFPTEKTGEKCYIKLPEGDFTLVVVNNAPEEFNGSMEFTGENNISSFTALGVRDEQKTIKLLDHLSARSAESPEDYCIAEPDTLAAGIIQGVHISAQQIDYHYDRPHTDYSPEDAVEVFTQPLPLTAQVNVRAHVTGLKYARGTTMSFLRGLAAGTHPGTGKNTAEQASHGFILNNRTFDPGSDSDGTIRASFLAFGLPDREDARYLLDINFVLINGEKHPVSFDVTDLIQVDVALRLTLSLDLEIELPEVVGTDGGGFDTDIDDWNDEDVEIPM